MQADRDLMKSRNSQNCDVQLGGTKTNTSVAFRVLVLRHRQKGVLYPMIISSIGTFYLLENNRVIEDLFIVYIF